jgi:DNA-directed RNA polymerase subunit RPC12/RpoP
MAIQFSCSQCNQPIEVDDAHAGQAAACPYCRHVVTVPEQSTFRPESAVAARPTNVEVGGAGSQWPGVPTGPGAELHASRFARAYALGRYALTCSVVAIVLFLMGAMISMISKGGIPSTVDEQGHQRPTGELFKELQESPAAPWVSLTQFSAMAVALVGLVMAIVSLYQVRQGNGRAWAAVAISGLLLFCVCAGTLVVILIMAAQGGIPGV